MRRDGVSGRCPTKNTKSNCEMPRIIKGGKNKQTSCQSIEKKHTSIEILSLYNYTVVDDCCIKETDWRLINSNYRKNRGKEGINLMKKKINTY